MPKRKSAGTTTGKKKSARRSSSRSVGKVNVMEKFIDAGIGAAGAVGTAFVASKLPIATKMKPIVPLAAGLALMVAGKKNKTLQRVGEGALIAGVLAMVRTYVPAIPLIAGEDDLSVMGYTEVAGELPFSPTGDEDMMGYTEVTDLEGDEIEY